VARARRLARAGVGLGAVVLLALLLYASRDGLAKVRATFFNGHFLADSFPTVIRGFWLNVKLFVVSEVLVLVWGLVVAIARSLPGRPAAPIRWLAIAYIDLFRGLPALVTIYLVGFGLPLAGLPVVRSLTLFQLGVLALTLVYGAYVAEVYRAGIESVHWSQAAAARSLGMSHGQAMRFVVVPQAVRRVIPPLLNDFIGLQKDTALVSVIGVLEGFNRARIYAGNRFNLSSVVGLGLCFVVITIPMARFTDYLLRRDQARRLAG
jgi:polar amino acid transport system permease protein